MSIRLCAVAAVLLLSGTYQGSPPAEAPAQAVVRGIVSSESGARIGGADVHFTSEGRKVVTQTWSDGTYDAKLPPGIYNVIVTDGEGFCPGRRAEFSARTGAEINFDFMLKVGAIAEGLTTDKEGHANTFSRLEYCYESEELSAPVEGGLKPMVLYGKREVDAGSVRYSSLVLLDRQYSVVYTYDLLTIHATRISYSTADHSVTGTGSVILQDGTTTKSGSRIEVTFRDGVPHVSLTN